MECPILQPISKFIKRDRISGLFYVMGLLGVDLVEHPEKGLVVNEINHTMEFHTMQPLSGIDIAGEIVEYVVKTATQNNKE